MASNIKEKNKLGKIKIVSSNGFITTLQRSNTMRQIKSGNTKPEILLRKALWNLGYRYKLNNTTILGKPDIVLLKYKALIFVDGDFWHGYRWHKRKPRLRNNKKYWISKIESNMKRDKKNNKILKRDGWNVIRIWEHEVKNNLEPVIQKIKKYL